LPRRLVAMTISCAEDAFVAASCACRCTGWALCGYRGARPCAGDEPFCDGTADWRSIVLDTGRTSVWRCLTVAALYRTLGNTASCVGVDGRRASRRGSDRDLAGEAARVAVAGAAVVAWLRDPPKGMHGWVSVGLIDQPAFRLWAPRRSAATASYTAQGFVASVGISRSPQSSPARSCFGLAEWPRWHRYDDARAYRHRYRIQTR